MYLLEKDNLPLNEVLDDLDKVDFLCAGVYGTLRKEGPANALMDGLDYLGKIRLTGNTVMWDAGAFPFITVSRRHVCTTVPRLRTALVELYSLDCDGDEQAREAALARLDRYEGVPYLYNRSYFYYNYIAVDDGEGNFYEGSALVIAYTWARVDDFDPNDTEYTPIGPGDWIKYVESGREDTRPEIADNYDREVQSTAAEVRRRLIFGEEHRAWRTVDANPVDFDATMPNPHGSEGPDDDDDDAEPDIDDYDYDEDDDYHANPF